MSYITLNQVKDIIEYVRFPCEEPENLERALNIFIGQYEQIKDSPQPSKRTEKNEIKKDHTNFMRLYERYTKDLLSSYILIESKKELLLAQGLSKQQVEIALLVILTTQEINEDEKKYADQLIEEQIKSIPEGPQIRFKNVFLCSLLPRIYETHFNRAFGTSRSDITNEYGGPGVRFIQAVSEHMGIPMKGPAIAQAYKRFKA